MKNLYRYVGGVLFLLSVINRADFEYALLLMLAAIYSMLVAIHAEVESNA